VGFRWLGKLELTVELHYIGDSDDWTLYTKKNSSVAEKYIFMAITMAKLLYGHFHMVQYHIIIFLAIFGESPQNSFGQKNIWYSSRSSTYWILEISHWTWWIFPLFISQHIISILWYKKYIDVNTYTESKAHTIFCSTLLCYVDHRGAPKLLVLTPADDFLTHQTMSVWYPSFFQRPQGKHPRWLENHQYI
jgi:hypothetical protein